MTTNLIENCNYCSPSGVKCSEAVQPGEKSCLLHNGAFSTESPIKEKIEEMVREEHSLAGFNLKKAEEIYRNLKLSYKLQGQAKYESPFFYREMVVQHKQMPLFSLHRIWFKFFDLTTGYGEKPTRIVLTMAADILIAAILYGLLGLKYGESHLSFWGTDLPVGEMLFNLLYFSTVVFTTVGFGDITPMGASKVVMMLQGLSGQILIAFFIVALYKKLMSR